MPVYDDDKKDLDSLNPAELQNLEQEYSTKDDENEDEAIEEGADPEDLKRGGLGRKLRQRGQAVGDRADEAAHKETMGKVDNIIGGLGEGEGEGSPSGFYRPGKGLSGKKPSRLAAGRGVLKRRGLIAGIGGGGILTTILIAGSLFNFLHTFQLEHFFKNVEEKTGSRLMASLDSRNKNLVQAYIRVRATEIQGGTANDNLYFKANKVKTGDPMKDWYETMRTSKFEKDLLERNGITFTAMVDPDGKISTARLTELKDRDPDLAKAYGFDDVKDPTDYLNKVNNVKGEDMEKLFTVDVHDSHKTARKSVKQVVNKEVPWWRTFKRRHLRKDIANTTGIKNWRFFEKTRDKISKDKQAAKDAVLNKILDKYYVNNPTSAQFMKCLFSNGRCSTTTDPASPDNHAEDPVHGGTPDELANADSTPESVDANGKKIEAGALDTKAVGNEIKDVVDKEIQDSVSGEVAKQADKELVKFSPFQKIILGAARTLAGDTVSDSIPFNPTKVWTWAVRIAKVDGLLVAPEGASKLSKMISNSRSSQAEGIYATYALANDNIKSGKLVGTELNDFFATFKNAGNSEGWAMVSGSLDKGKVSAAGTTNLDKNAYCAPDHVPTFEEFAWLCDALKPLGPSNAAAISKVYNDTVAPITHPIREGVDTVQKSPIGDVATWVTGILDSTLGKIIDPVVNTVFKDTGVGKGLVKYMGMAMFKLMGFLGGSPIFEPGKPGVANPIIVGAAASAEGSTRSSGGIKSNKKSLAYSTSLETQYNAQKSKDESLVSRYASLNNPDSLAASSLFALSNNTSLTQIPEKLASYIGSLPSQMGNIFSGRVFAQQQKPSANIADWANVTKYDIPQVCMDLNPLDPNYLTKSTNVERIGLSATTLGYDTLRDTDKFWKAVYDKLDADKNPDPEAASADIYNCALFDARVMGNLGYVYGYNKDNGYGQAGSTASP